MIGFFRFFQKSRRKRLIINREFQYSFIKKDLLFLLLTAALFFILVIVWNRYKVKQGFLLDIPSVEEVSVWAEASGIPPADARYWQRFIEKAKPYTFLDIIWKPLLVVLLINGLLLFIFSLLYSNSIAGPVYRIMGFLKKKIAGEKTEPLSFRKGDFFHEIAELLNKIFEKYPLDRS